MGLHDGRIGPGRLRLHRARRRRSSTRRCPARRRLPLGSVARSWRAVRPRLLHASTPVSSVAGVILNKVGSPRHEAEVRDGVALDRSPRSRRACAATPELVVAEPPPRPDPGRRTPARSLEAAVAALSSMAQKYVDLDALVELAGTAPDLDVQPWDPVAAVAEFGRAAGATPPVVAVAGGAAFSFGYAETSELLVAAGSRGRWVRPHPRRVAASRGLGSACRREVLPEMHASDLAANTPLRRAIRKFADDGGAISAECAGLLYLGRELDGAPMCGGCP